MKDLQRDLRWDPTSNTMKKSIKIFEIFYWWRLNIIWSKIQNNSSLKMKYLFSLHSFWKSWLCNLSKTTIFSFTKVFTWNMFCLTKLQTINMTTTFKIYTMHSLCYLVTLIMFPKMLLMKLSKNKRKISSVARRKKTNFFKWKCLNWSLTKLRKTFVL